MNFSDTSAYFMLVGGREVIQRRLLLSSPLVPRGGRTSQQENFLATIEHPSTPPPSCCLSLGELPFLFNKEEVVSIQFGHVFREGVPLGRKITDCSA